MRHVIGFLLCLVFVSIVLMFVGEFSPLTKPSQDRVEAAVVQAAVDFTPSPYDTFAPLFALGQVFAIIISPVGALGLAVYLMVIWMLPAH